MTCVHARKCNSVYVFVCMYISTYVCMCVCMIVRTYSSMYVCVCMHASMYLCTYVCMYVRINVYMCIRANARIGVLACGGLGVIKTSR